MDKNLCILNKPFTICFNQQKITTDQLGKLDNLLKNIELGKINNKEKLQIPINLSDIIILTTRIHERAEVKLRKDASIIICSAICKDESIFSNYNPSTLDKSQCVISRIFEEFINYDIQEYKLEIFRKKIRVIASEKRVTDFQPISDIDLFIMLCNEMESLCNDISANKSKNYQLLTNIEECINKYQLETLTEFFDENAGMLKELLEEKRLADIKKLYLKKQKELERLKYNTFIIKNQIKKIYFLTPQSPLQKIIENVKHISTLPQIYQKLKNMIDDEQSSIKDIAQTMEQDPAYASEALRKIKENIIIMSKSIIFNPGGRKINDFTDALLMVGIDVLYGIIHIIPVFNMSGRKQFNLSQLWIHSFKTAMGIKYLAKKYKCDEPISFTLGIIHDIGKIFLMQTLPDDYMKVIDRINSEIRVSKDAKISIEKAGLSAQFVRNIEKEVFEFDHAEIGKLICDEWNLYSRYGELIGSHHHPNLNDKLGFLLYLADMFDISAQFDFWVPDWISNDWKDDLEQYMGLNLIMIKKWTDVLV